MFHTFTAINSVCLYYDLHKFVHKAVMKIIYSDNKAMSCTAGLPVHASCMLWTMDNTTDCFRAELLLTSLRRKQKLHHLLTRSVALFYPLKFWRLF